MRPRRPRRSLDEIRKHLRARVARLERSTYYDVLEITPLAEYPEIEASYQLLGSRYSPQALAPLRPRGARHARQADVGARREGAQRARRSRAARALHRLAAPEPRDAEDPVGDRHRGFARAAEAFTKGQAALGEGDAHRAMGDFAKAARHQPGASRLRSERSRGCGFASRSRAARTRSSRPCSSAAPSRATWSAAGRGRARSSRWRCCARRATMPIRRAGTSRSRCRSIRMFPLPPSSRSG